jgi:hypothetical protein
MTDSSSLSDLVDSGALKTPDPQGEPDVLEVEIEADDTELVEAIGRTAQTLRDKIGGLEVMRVSEQEFNFNLMIYGRPGVGKTVLAASSADVPDMGPVLFLDIEGGTLSAAAMNYDCDTVRIRTWVDFQNIYEDIYAGRTPYKTVVLDSLTEIQKFSMLNIMYQNIQEDSGRDPDIPAIRDWGKNSEQTRRLIRGFRDLPINTIFTALVIEEKNQKTGLVEKKPQLSGKLSGEAAGFLDIVLYMYLKTVEDEPHRLLLSEGNETTVAKDRSGGLPQIVIDPTMAEIHEAITSTTNN